MSDALDGNAAAGTLAEIFVPEMTAAITICATCGDARPLGELRAHMHAPGLVLRCVSCGAVEVRFVQSVDRSWLDLRGVRVLQCDRPHDSP